MKCFLITLLAFSAACAPATQPAAPAPVSPAVQFVRDMIAHHAQAIELSTLASGRAARDAIELMAERIDVSQRDEIARMNRWLAARGLPTLDPAHAAHEAHAGMPGMMTAAELSELRSASGSAFDRLFLEMMIRHHEGALIMVERLSAAAESVDADLWELASSIDADQRAEITRMRALLSNIQ